MHFREMFGICSQRRRRNLIAWLFGIEEQPRRLISTTTTEIVDSAPLAQLRQYNLRPRRNRISYAEESEPETGSEGGESPKVLNTVMA